MPKSPQALLTLPPPAIQALRGLGENLAIARNRRRESQRAWAKRMGISVPTLIRMERGDPGVAVRSKATCGLPCTGVRCALQPRLRRARSARR
jgi:hypothetical protein